MSMIRRSARAWDTAPKELASVIVARLLVSYGDSPDNAQHRKHENNDRWNEFDTEPHVSDDRNCSESTG